MTDQLFIRVPLQEHTALLRQLTAALTGNMRLGSPSGPARGQVEAAVGEVLFHVTNFPEPAQARLLGQDMSPLRRVITDAVFAVLSPPAPSATCGETRPHDAHEGDRGHGDEPDIDWVHWSCPGVPVAPPSTADMVPGTTFTARLDLMDGFTERRVFMRVDGVDAVDDAGARWHLSDIDPSTIRDVTPPAASEVE